MAVCRGGRPSQGALGQLAVGCAVRGLDREAADAEEADAAGMKGLRGKGRRDSGAGRSLPLVRSWATAWAQAEDAVSWCPSRPSVSLIFSAEQGLGIPE